MMSVCVLYAVCRLVLRTIMVGGECFSPVWVQMGRLVHHAAVEGCVIEDVECCAQGRDTGSWHAEDENLHFFWRWMRRLRVNQTSIRAPCKRLLELDGVGSCCGRHVEGCLLCK